MVNHRHLLFIVEHLQDSLDCSRRKVSLPRKRKVPLSFFFFVSSADSAITTLISRSRQVRLGRRTEEETTGIPGHRKPLGVRHSLRDGLRIPRVPLFDSIASYPSALARSLTPRVFTSTDFFPLDLLSGKSVEGVPSTYCNPTFSSSYKTLKWFCWLIEYQ